MNSIGAGLNAAIGVDIAFGLLAILALVAGWRVFRTYSMVRASFFLLLTFLAAGGVMLLVAPYLGVAMFFIMAVAMMVMALFMVMLMMNPVGLNPMDMVHQERVAEGAGVGAFFVMGAMAFFAVFPSQPRFAGGEPVRSLGMEMLDDSMLTFEPVGWSYCRAFAGATAAPQRAGCPGDDPVGKCGSADPEASGHSH